MKTTRTRSLREANRQETSKSLRDAEDLVLRTVIAHQGAMQHETSCGIDLSLASQQTQQARKEMNAAGAALDRLQKAARGA